MIDYSKWEKDNHVKISNLHVDYLNPRFSKHDVHLSQNNLINEMVDKYKIYDLSKSITDNGFYPDKTIIAVRENGKNIVLEGNRRISALKCLINPDIVQGKDKEKFLKLHTIVDQKYIETITVVFAPTRDAANPIIFKEHTGSTAMPWSRIMQAEFYIRQISNGMSIDELEHEYHRSKSDINRFLKLYYMYNVALSLNYSDETIQAKVEDKQEFPASVLERIYDAGLMRDFLGITFSADGRLVGEKDLDQFKNAYVRIITDIVEKKEDTRTLNDDKGMKRYIEKLVDCKPKKSGIFCYDDIVQSKENSSIPLSLSKNSKKSISKRTSIGIIPSGLPFTLNGASSLKKNYDELRKLSVRAYPNATAIMLRTFLDKSLRMYLKSQCKINRITVKENKESIEKRLSDCSLGEVIDYIISPKAKVIEDTNIIKTIKKFKNNDKQMAGLQLLNAAVHNEEISFLEEEVRNLWPDLEGLFKIILTEPQDKND